MPIQEGSYGLLRGWSHRRQTEILTPTLTSHPPARDLEGKVALITGGTSGLGKVVVEKLAVRGARVFLAARSPQKSQLLIDEVRRENPKVDIDIEVLEFDASSLKSAHGCGKEFLARNQGRGLHMLMLNAGSMVGEKKGTREGVEWMFGVNCLAGFVLTLTVLEALERGVKGKGEEGGGKGEGGDVRVVSTASAGFAMWTDEKTLRLGDEEVFVGEGKGDGGGFWNGCMPMYGRSKTCQILFAAELSRRLRRRDWGRGVRSNSLHPGTVGGTGLNDGVKGNWVLGWLEWGVFELFKIPTDAGAVNMLYAAASPEVREMDITGKYLTPYGYVNDAAVKGKPAANEELGRQLWQRSIELCERLVPELEIPEWIR